MGKKSSNLDDLLDFIEDYVGPAGREVFRLLAKATKEMLDNEIIEKTGLNEQEVRRVLYELHNLGLVTYRKSRNPEDSRYIYFWRVDSARVNQVLLQRKKAVLNKLKERLEYEESHTFFVCTIDGVRLTFDEAMENDFKCPRCGSELIAEENEEVKERLRKIIRVLEEEIKREEKLIGS
ncbi:MAG TPA: transcription factor [Thermoprotei archaeon]|nr:transcription factor [Thermoprotei archaeon]